MQIKELMKKLESLGTAQNRKVFSRHGFADNFFGVSFGDLNKLKKKIGTDDKLARQLWRTGNLDGRFLATMVGDPEKMTFKDLDGWGKDLDNYMVTDCFSRYLASQTPHAKKAAEKWIKSKSEWIGQAGWVCMSVLAMIDQELSDSYFDGHLKTIEKGIHERKNRVRHAMNMALISIGMRNPALEKKAFAAARRIGKVEVDHGDTSCKTPDAIPYIKNAKAQRAKRKKKRSA